MSAPGPSILVADGEEGMRDLARYCLEPLGYRIDTAADGPEAVGAVGRRAYDLVVLDAHVPRMAGPDALDAIERLRPGQRVLLVSSSPDPGHRLEEAARRGIPCLFKPISLDELVGAIEALLAGAPGGAP